MGRETDLKEWRDRLSKYYADTAIRRLYSKHNGSYKGLTDLLMKKMRTRKTIKGRIDFRKTSSIAWRIYGDETGYLKSRRAWKSKKKKKKVLLLFTYMN